MFVAKYSGTGFAYKWAKVIAGNSNVSAASVATDGQNNIFLTGFFSGTSNFGVQTLNAGTATSDGFLAKYSGAGANIWAKQFGATSWPSSGNGAAVALDSSGHPLVTGSFQGTVNFAGQPLTSTGGSIDIVVGRLNP
jgi:hypothetical protein